MYGGFIGDFVGSKYKFRNMKTKEFPLFSPGCAYTDDSVMITAVAKAIMLSREAQNNRGESRFQKILIDVMQDFGRRYPNPAGAYAGKFDQWLRQKDPKPYGSYGNGSAMRGLPCGLAAVTIDEAKALAKASADITHNHPEGIKGAEAVSVAVFLAKCGRSKTEIRRYISEHYYSLEFTLDSIRNTYQYDATCQGTVPQAIVAFLESENFEDAIRNVISIGGDSDTLGAITGAIAWTYYAIQTGKYDGWVYDKFDPTMLEIRKQAMLQFPKEFLEIAEKFHEMCWRRAGTYDRAGMCTPILNQGETEEYSKSPYAPSGTLTPELESEITAFCNKYMVLMELLYRDKELNDWCDDYSAYQEPAAHHGLKELIYGGFMKEAYELGIVTGGFSWDQTSSCPTYTLEAALGGGKLHLVRGICTEIRLDYGCNGALIYNAIAKGKLYRLLHEWLRRKNFEEMHLRNRQQ